jgi:hypothetical protein
MVIVAMLLVTFGKTALKIHTKISKKEPYRK